MEYTVRIPLHPALVIGLTALGILSPLLTFSKLFQMKEWRWDRLREHLRREGWVTPLFGTVRLFVLCLAIPTLLTPFVQSALVVTLGVFAALTVAQFGLRRQPTPVWTKKAMMVTTGAFVLSLVAVYATFFDANGALWLPFIVVGQPLFVGAVWALLLPLDGVLKRRVMRHAAADRANRADLKVIGIAGSVGKTTTKELLKHLLQDLKPLATPAHVNTEMGVAGWLLSKLDATGSSSTSPELHASNHESRITNLLIVEMGAYREGEVGLLCDIAQPDIGVLTALGSDHLALFGSEEAIRRANAELIQSLPEHGHGFVLATDEASKKIAAEAPCPVTTVGPLGDLKAQKVEEKGDGLHVTIDGHAVRLPLRGAHNAQNFLLAASVARHLGISWERIAQLAPSFKSTSHTFHVTNDTGVTVLDDTYNISFLSAKAALEWAKERKERPRVLLTNGLLEVGAQEHEYHRNLGEVANGCVERAVFLNPKAAKAFGETFKSEISALENVGKLPKGALLLAVGRMPLSVIQKLLP